MNRTSGPVSAITRAQARGVLPNIGTDRFDEVYADRFDRRDICVALTGGETVAVACPIEEAVRERVSQTTSISAQSDEPHLIAAAKAGDQRAYGKLLERHQAVAYRAACLITGSAAEAEDATQEACVKAWLALRRFRSDAPFRPWLVRIAINEARNRRRSAGRQASLVLRLAPDFAHASAVPSAETEVVAGEERARLASAVGRLREDDQLVIAARYFLGLSEAEAAIALGLRRGTVKSRLSRALSRLQGELGAIG